MGLNIFFIFGILLCLLLTSLVVCQKKNEHLRQSDRQPEFYNSAAVVTNSFDCTNIGLNILRRGGSVADSAIAALLCEGVTNPHSMGIGGGFILTIYIKRKGKAEILNARECAPCRSNKYMFSECDDVKMDIASGGLSVAVPGELKGYWELHRKYGKLDWSELFTPTIRLLERGVYVSAYLSGIISRLAVEIISSPSLKAIFLNRETGELYKEGELMLRPKLVETLTKIAEKGPDYLYNGPLTNCLVQDIKDQGGIITKEDLKKYKPRWMKPLSTIVDKDLVVYTAPSPAAGCPLLVVLDVISKMVGNGTPVVFWHRIVEAWKYAYGLKSQQSGPMMSDKKLVDHCYNCTVTDYIRGRIKDYRTCNKTTHYFGVYEPIEDSGTAHISIVAPNGDAISVTSTINLMFGALFASPSTGIILNNQMMDFYIPGHHSWKANPANCIAPSKQPMSTMCPTIIVNQHDDTVRMVIGASGGFKILTATSLVVKHIKHLWFGDSVEDAVAQPRLHHQLKPEDAVAQPRLHHQLKPMVLEYEHGFPKDILRGLYVKGHVLRKFRTRGGGGRPRNGIIGMPVNSAVNVISIENGEIHAVGDCRRNGFADGF
ncbi:hypothetical protein QE152_g4046 [Popillia japonica]|uniref:Uncharacterized protein n=1 Tax=Popillia japonica TaxID=7064 RepID=A0AAW1N2Q0_POPJA